MALATRLTRGGKLLEATQVLQHLIRGHAEPSPQRDEEGSTPALGSAHAGGTGSRPRKGLGETIRDLVLVRSAGAHLRKALVHPEVLPPGATFETASFSNGAGKRDYNLYIPGSASSDQRRALIVMLHGCTQTPDDFAAGTRMNNLAEEHGFLVAYPAQPSSANPSKCWNWFSPNDQRHGRGEPSIVAGMTRDIIQRHHVDPRRVYAAGLSAGAAAAVILGSEYSDLFAAIGVHSGLPSGAAHDAPSAFAAMRNGANGNGARVVPSIVFHGDSDPTVHPLNSDHVVRQSTGAVTGLIATVERGAASGGHAYRRTLFSAPSGRVICEKWTVHGAGHAWSGGSPAGSYTDPRGPDASREMLRFFLLHQN